MNLIPMIRRAIARRRRALQRGDRKGAASALAVVQKLRSKRLRQTVAFDGVPVPRGVARMLKDIRDHGARFRLLSGDRRKGVAERFHHQSQAALYACWLARRPGCNPANPPGRSTHELRSDGVAYRGPLGRRLLYWQIGMDFDGADDVLRVGHQLGYALFRPYSSGSEAHHLNLKRRPHAPR
jgi:hypothetical protein